MGWLVIFRAPHDDIPGPFFSSRSYADSYLDRLIRDGRTLAVAQALALRIGFPPPERLIAVDLIAYAAGEGPTECVRSLDLTQSKEAS